MIARGQGRPFFSDAFCAAIAALKYFAKRSYTFTYYSRYREIFCLALTAQKAPETSLSNTCIKSFGASGDWGAIAALKYFAKRSYTFTYYSRYREIFCLALTTQKAPETSRLIVW
jgi:hypothetical protein